MLKLFASQLRLKYNQLESESTSTSFDSYSQSQQVTPNAGNSYQSIIRKTLNAVGVVNPSSPSIQSPPINAVVTSVTSRRTKKDIMNKINFIFDSYHAYSEISYIYDNQFGTFNNSLHSEASKAYEKYLETYIKTSFNVAFARSTNAWGSSTTQDVALSITSNSIFDILRLVTEHQQKDHANNRYVTHDGSVICFPLFSDSKWSNMQVECMVGVLELLWNGEIGDGYFSRANLRFGIVSTYGNSHMKISKNVSIIDHAIEVTVNIINRILSNDNYKDLINNIKTHVIIPLISEMPYPIMVHVVNPRIDSIGIKMEMQEPTSFSGTTDNSFSVADEDVTFVGASTSTATNSPKFTVLSYLEDVLCATISPSSAMPFDVSLSLIRRKILLRQHLPGYTTCLREYVNQNLIIKHKFYPMLHSILHDSIPQCDVDWMQTFDINDQTFDYVKVITNNITIKFDVKFFENYIASCESSKMMETSTSFMTNNRKEEVAEEKVSSDTNNIAEVSTTAVPPKKRPRTRQKSPLVDIPIEEKNDTSINPMSTSTTNTTQGTTSTTEVTIYIIYV
jgi:hypothetical protein